MAALAIPIVVLGSLYILSEQEKNKNKENFIQQNTKNKEQNKQNIETFSNYETKKIDNFALENQNLVNSYTNSNQHTDKYFSDNNQQIQNNNQQMQNNNQQMQNNNQVNLMNGQKLNVNEFKHNNMQPYYGAKIRGPINDLNNTESVLDNKQGYGSQQYSKSEQAPLFKPDENVNLPHGTANNSDFFQSRMNESMKMSNVTLWEPQRVGPGLNLGYGSQNENGFNRGGVNGSDGFNAGMMSRDSWKPKTVDELRVDNNPKNSFDLNGHQGPAISIIKNQGPNDKIGKIEKHLPDKFYESGPQRWFTTTGSEKNPMIRSEFIMPNENRIDTTREYYGGGNDTHRQHSYVNPEYEESKKIGLSQLPISNATATGQNIANPNDYSNKSYNILPNNRTTDKNRVEMGGVYGIAKSVVAPILDILKPTRKENIIGNLRQSGNVNGLNPGGHLFNRNDKTKVTNREMSTNKIDMNYLNVQGQNNQGNANLAIGYQPIQNQRGTTNLEYLGAGSQNTGLRPYNAAYAQENNVNKTYESRPNQGGMNLFNNHNNVEIYKNENILKNNRGNISNGGPNIIPSSEFMGEINGMQSYDNNFNASRMDESLLNAFKNNPYTRSLSSVA